MSTITITLPDEMKSFMEQESAQRGYPSISDFFHDIVVAFKEYLPDAEQVKYLSRPDIAKEIEEKLLEGLNTPNVVIDEEYWQERQRQRRERHPEAYREGAVSQ